MDQIKPGVVGEYSLTVTENLTASHVGSGSLRVFSTPAMITFMERAAVTAIDPLLPPGYASVGTVVNVRHLAAALIGQMVRARAEVTAVNGRQVDFTVQAWDGNELIGEGTHTRFVIDTERFLSRLAEKKKAQG